MQSPMITLNPDLLPATLDAADEGAVKNRYTELRVLQSAAGFYVGTLYEELDETGAVVWQEPGSRDSGYFPTHEAAALELRQIEGGDLSDVRFNP